MAATAQAQPNFVSVKRKLAKGLFHSKPIPQTTRFDVQDVSYLWPKYDENKLIRVLADNGRDRDLLPDPEVYSRLQDFLNSDLKIAIENRFTGKKARPSEPTDTIRNTVLSDFRVVAFRVDNCGPFAGHEDRFAAEHWKVEQNTKSLSKGKLACLPQLRLILQPLMHWEDVALHFIYTFSEEQIPLGLLSTAQPDLKIAESLFSDLLKLKSMSPIITDGLPLGPHLGLNDLNFHTKVSEFLKFYAQPEYLTEIAVLSTNAFDGNAQWVFLSIEIDHRKPVQLNLKPLHSVKGSPLTLGFTPFNSNENTERPQLTIVDPTSAPLTNAYALANPRITNPRSVDCLSCHSETRTFRAQAPRVWPVTKVDLPSYKGITGLPQAEYLPKKHGIENNFRQFGYFDSAPVVTLRTALESARVAATLNRQFFGSETGNGLTCNLEKALNCLFSNEANCTSTCSATLAQ